MCRREEFVLRRARTVLGRAIFPRSSKTRSVFVRHADARVQKCLLVFLKLQFAVARSNRLSLKDEVLGAFV